MGNSAETSKFEVDTNGMCFICFSEELHRIKLKNLKKEEIERDTVKKRKVRRSKRPRTRSFQFMSEDEDETGSDDSESESCREDHVDADDTKEETLRSTTSFQKISRYLKIDMGKVFSSETTAIPGHLLKTMEKSDIRVTLCEECGFAAQNLTKLVEAFEKAKLEVGNALKMVRERLKFPERDDKVKQSYWEKVMNYPQALLHVGIVEKLRQETIEKCEGKIAGLHPTVILERINCTKLNTTPVPPIDSRKRKMTDAPESNAPSNSRKSITITIERPSSETTTTVPVKSLKTKRRRIVSTSSSSSSSSSDSSSENQSLMERLKSRNSRKKIEEVTESKACTKTASSTITNLMSIPSTEKNISESNMHSSNKITSEEKDKLNPIIAIMDNPVPSPTDSNPGPCLQQEESAPLLLSRKTLKTISRRSSSSSVTASSGSDPVKRLYPFKCLCCKKRFRTSNQSTSHGLSCQRRKKLASKSISCSSSSDDDCDSDDDISPLTSSSSSAASPLKTLKPPATKNMSAYEKDGKRNQSENEPNNSVDYSFVDSLLTDHPVNPSTANLGWSLALENGDGTNKSNHICNRCSRTFKTLNTLINHKCVQLNDTMAPEIPSLSSPSMVTVANETDGGPSPSIPVILPPDISEEEFKIEFILPDNDEQVDDEDTSNTNDDILPEDFFKEEVDVKPDMDNSLNQNSFPDAQEEPDENVGMLIMSTSSLQEKPPHEDQCSSENNAESTSSPMTDGEPPNVNIDKVTFQNIQPAAVVECKLDNNDKDEDVKIEDTSPISAKNDETLHNSSSGWTSIGFSGLQHKSDNDDNSSSDFPSSLLTLKQQKDEQQKKKASIIVDLEEEMVEFPLIVTLSDEDDNEEEIVDICTIDEVQGQQESSGTNQTEKISTAVKPSATTAS